MIQGTSSSVGKSVLAAAICRIFARRGLRVAPFKSQNMALNSFITSAGKEMGRAQVVQAMAAGREPEVAMNPVLLKPLGNARSEVILMGRPWRTLSAGDYYRCRETLWGAVVSSFEKLAGENDLVIVEGAGSPAEINLKGSEIVNMRVAKAFNCPVLLAGDIDRGGVFASLVGTLALLDSDERALVKGILINKFRGDVKLLEPGLEMLSGLTGGVPLLGVIPWLSNLAVAREDSLELEESRASQGPCEIDVAVIKFPRITDYDDFDPLALEEGVSVRFVEYPEDVGNPAAIILPGTNAPREDLAWLRRTGLDGFLGAQILSGRAVAGLAEGCLMMAGRVSTALGTDVFEGLGLLPGEAVLGLPQGRGPEGGTTLPCEGFPGVEPLSVEGYGSAGELTLPEGSRGLLSLSDGRLDGALSAEGRIWGSTLHGVFDGGDFRSAWLRFLGKKEGGEALSFKEAREKAFDRLADEVEAALDMRALEEIIDL